MIELTPILDKKTSDPIYIQLAHYIKQEILSGRIRPGEKLPSKRQLANHLGLSLNTINSSYEQLCAEGYVESHPRRGLFVMKMDEEILNLEESQIVKPKVHFTTPEIKYNFNSGRVDLKNFPYTIWRKLTVQSLYEDQGELFYNGDPQGEYKLREQIANYLFASRGVKCTPEQIVMGAGNQVLIGLLCLIIGKNLTYAIENPGYYRANTVLQNYGVNTTYITLDEDGIDMNILTASGANVVYVTPSHQYPFGMIMPIHRRMELLKWAEESDGYIIEDDYDGEYRFRGKPIPSLQGLDTNGRVIYLGTFSKSLIPSIRIGYMVLPPALLKIYQETYTVYQQTVSRLHQDTLYRFMKEGYWQSHLNKMRTLYRKKHNILLSAMKKHLGESVTVIGEKSGLHIVLEVVNGMMESELISSALEAGVKVYPFSLYYHGSIEKQLPKVLLGFGSLSESEIEEGILLLKEAWSL
jgi:GntR family transcriptional regulator / MocR family aminotransferase